MECTGQDDDGQEQEYEGRDEVRHTGAEDRDQRTQIIEWPILIDGGKHPKQNSTGERNEGGESRS
jgi:hypothetical protein